VGSLTWIAWRVSPFITSIFFILGVFTLYEVLVDWIKSKVHLWKPDIREHTIDNWCGILYMVLFIFGLQLTIAGKPVSWEFMNFQLIAIVFCAYFLKIHIQPYIFVSIVVIFMILNSSILYWESWTYSFVVMFFYWSMNFLADYLQERKYAFFPYIAVGIIYGGVLWYLMEIKFSLSWTNFWQEWIYLIVFEMLLYSYMRMLLRNDSLRDRLVEFANHDALTKAKNYAAYSSDIKYLFDSHQKNNLNLSMVMFDIDHFKKVNDTYGHLAGDEVLKNVVNIVQTVIDEDDPQINLYRTGGEEFNITFPGYDLDDTEVIVREIFAALNHLEIPFNGQTINISVSMGVSEAIEKDIVPTDFYNRVDSNLYHSKQNGRMRITAV